MTTIIEARGLVAGYGSVEIVRELDLEISAGEVVALLGPNGAGKTTTLLTLAGHLASLRGEILWHGRPTTAPPHVRAREGLGLVTEERAVFMQMTVADNLAVSRCDKGRALELFPELEAHFDRRVGLLSGGQQQMIALARCLARPTTVLLADELSLGLAPLIVDRLLQAVRTAADEGIGVLLVEQHVHKAIAVADRILVMRRGEIELEGTRAEIALRMDEVQASYLATQPVSSTRVRGTNR